MKMLDEICFKIEDFLTSLKYEKKTSPGLRNPVYPMEFNVSLGNYILFPFLNRVKPIENEIKCFLIDPCFRRLDLQSIAYSPVHLSFFEMAGFFHCGSLKQVSPIENIIKNMFDLLTNVLSFNPDELLVTVSEGGRFKNIEVQPEFRALNTWKSLGVKNIIMVPGRRNFIYREPEGSFGGPAYEIFYMLNQNSKKMFIEIGSTIELRYITKGGQLFPLRVNSGFNVGFGLERILTALQKKISIFEIDIIFPMMKKLYSKFRTMIEAQIELSHLKVIVDRLRAISFIVADGQTIDSTSRGKILSRLFKEVYRELNYLNIFSLSLIEDLLYIIDEAYSQRNYNIRKYIPFIVNIFQEISKK